MKRKKILAIIDTLLVLVALASLFVSMGFAGSVLINTGAHKLMWIAVAFGALAIGQIFALVNDFYEMKQMKELWQDYARSLEREIARYKDNSM